MIQRTLLDTGIEVVTETTTSRSVAVGMYVRVGSRDEQLPEWGSAHFLEHLLFKGTPNRTAHEISASIESVGGDLNAYTSREITCFNARVLAEDAPLAFDVISDMLVRPDNTGEHVEIEREVVFSELDVHHDTPEELVHADIATLLYGDAPIARETLGSHDSVEALERATIHGFFTRWYRPENLVVSASGGIDHGTVVQMVGDHLGDLGRPGGALPERVAPVVVDGPAVNVRNRPTEQAQICLAGPAYLRDDPRRWAMRVLATAIGGGMSSRLFQQIREARGLAYSTYAYTSSTRDAGSIAAYLGTSPEKAPEAIRVLREVLADVADTITADEVARAKGQIRGATVLGCEDAGALMSRNGEALATGHELRSIDAILADVAAVDLDQVRAAAHDLLPNMTRLAVVGPFPDPAPFLAAG